MKSFIKYIILTASAILLFSVKLSAQVNLRITDLFAASTLTKDSLVENTEVRISFVLNRPDQAARVVVKIGNDVDSNEVFLGTATIERSGKKLFSLLNGQYIELKGDKVYIRWKGNKAAYSKARYVTLTAQGNDGSVSDSVHSFIRFF